MPSATVTSAPRKQVSLLAQSHQLPSTSYDSRQHPIITRVNAEPAKSQPQHVTLVVDKSDGSSVSQMLRNKKNLFITVLELSEYD